MKKIAVLGLAVLLSACSAIPVDQQVGQLDSSYDFGVKEPKNNLQLAIVSPEGGISRLEQINNKMNKFALLMNSNRTIKNNRVTIHNKYYKEVRSAFEQGLEELITTRGFNYSGPYQTFDDITFGDKKSSYLAIVPLFEMSVSEQDVHLDNGMAYTEETGVISVDGSVVVKMIEPLTKQTIMQKRIDLSKLDIKEPYIIQQEKSVSGDLIGKAFDAAVKQAAKPEKLTVTYDKAYATAMQKFYDSSMQQLAKYLTAEELLYYRHDITELKGKKRF